MTHRIEHNPQAIRERRIVAGLHQKVLAERAGISKSHMSSIEAGRRGASPPVLAAFAEALDCTVADLLAEQTAA